MKEAEKLSIPVMELNFFTDCLRFVKHTRIEEQKILNRLMLVYNVKGLI